MTDTKTKMLEAELVFYKAREEHFAHVLGVADGGQFRNDWDARIENLVKNNENLTQQVESDKRLIEELHRRVEELSKLFEGRGKVIEKLMNSETEYKAALAALKIDPTQPHEPLDVLVDNLVYKLAAVEAENNGALRELDVDPSKDHYPLDMLVGDLVSKLKDLSMGTSTPSNTCPESWCNCGRHHLKNGQGYFTDALRYRHTRDRCD